jgi:hypothetical protein
VNTRFGLHLKNYYRFDYFYDEHAKLRDLLIPSCARLKYYSIFSQIYWREKSKDKDFLIPTPARMGFVYC